MKNTIKYGSLIAGILVAATLGATAEEGKPRPDRPRGADRTPPKEILEKYDTDGSGKLEEGERAKLRADMEKRHAEMIAKYDTDKSGKLEEGERKQMMLDRFDKDDSGDLNDEEKAAARKAMQRRGPRPGGRRPDGKPGPRPDGKPGDRPDRKPGERPDRKPKA